MVVNLVIYFGFNKIKYILFYFYFLLIKLLFFQTLDTFEELCQGFFL